MRTRFASKFVKLTAFAAAAASVVGLVSVPSSAAANNTVPRLSVDFDKVAVGNLPNGSKAATGTLEFFEQAGVRGQLTGSLLGNGAVRVTWVNSRGEETRTSYSRQTYNGPAERFTLDSNASAGVVRATVAFIPLGSGNASQASESVVYVGDSPQSLGTCEQLDIDTVTVNSQFAVIRGDVRWSCEYGRPMFAIVNTRLERRTATNTEVWARFSTVYADGFQQDNGSASVRQGQDRDDLSGSSSGYDPCPGGLCYGNEIAAHSVVFEIMRSDTGQVIATGRVKFGDA